MENCLSVSSEKLEERNTTLTNHLNIFQIIEALQSQRGSFPQNMGQNLMCSRENCGSSAGR